VIRRFAAGELSEVLGRVTLEADRDSRAFRLRRWRNESYKGLGREGRGLPAAYARGAKLLSRNAQRNLSCGVHAVAG